MTITATPSVEWVDTSAGVISAVLPWRLPTLPSINDGDLSAPVRNRLRGNAIGIVHQITHRRFEIRRVTRRIVSAGPDPYLGPSIDLSLLDPIDTPRRVVAITIDGAVTLDWFQAEHRLYATAGTALGVFLGSCCPIWSANVELVIDEGESPPTEVLEAAAWLYGELVKMHLGDECDLPSNATSVSRDGVTVQLSPDFTDAVPMLGIVKRLYGDQISTFRLIDPTMVPLVAPTTRVEVQNGDSTRPLSITRGDTASFSFSFVEASGSGVVPTNIAGRTYAAQIRDGAGVLVATFTATPADAANGLLVLTLTSIQTAALVAGATYWWDLQETVGAEVTTMFVGSRVFVAEQVTQ